MSWSPSRWCSVVVALLESLLILPDLPAKIESSTSDVDQELLPESPALITFASRSRTRGSVGTGTCWCSASFRYWTSKRSGLGGGRDPTVLSDDRGAHTADPMMLTVRSTRSYSGARRDDRLKMPPQRPPASTGPGLLPLRWTIATGRTRGVGRRAFTLPHS